MALLDFQTSLAQLVSASSGGETEWTIGLTASERRYLSALTENPAFHFTAKVRRSWCIGRAAKAAYLTLSILPGETRDLLLNEWVDAGGGTQSFSGAESETFLEFIASHLSEPSHELSICQMELAALRAQEGLQHFSRPAATLTDGPNGSLRRGRYGGVVHFCGDPQQVLNALFKREPCPPLSTEITTLVFGPGLDRLYRMAQGSEAALYERLRSPVSAIELVNEGFKQETLHSLLDAGLVEYAEGPAESTDAQFRMRA